MYYPKTDLYVEELLNTFRLYKFFTMYCQNQKCYYTIYKMTASVSEKKIFVRRYDVELSAHLRSVAEKYHIVIIYYL